jgi:hypothetical protein
MNDSLYSIVLEYRGGTYISQISAMNQNAALTAWASSLSETELSAWKMNKTVLLKIVEGDIPIALEGCFNAWCLSGNIDGSLALINVFKTAKSR